jgi:hypothetical protein
MAAFDGLRARWERLGERERMLIGWGAAAVFVVAIGIAAALVSASQSELADDNAAMRQALKDLEQHRDAYLKAKAKSAQFESRIGHGNVQLEGMLETAANQSDILIAETNERQPQQLKNTKYTERSVDLRIRKCTLDQLAKFLRTIETGPNLVVVTGLTARVRDDKHEDLEVEMTVTTWERAPDTKGGKGKGGGGDKGDKPEAGKEGNG